MKNRPMQLLLKPGMPVPALSFRTVGGEVWDVAKTAPQTLDLIAVYRGVFCPYCRGFISDLASRLDEFTHLGIHPVAVSVDGEGRAMQAVEEWGLGRMAVGFGLSAELIRPWNVFLTTREQDGESQTFCEPALLMVTPQKKVYALLTQSIPSGRPDLGNLLEGLAFLAKQGFPIRGAA
jgi:peroxiredoxin